MSPTPGSLRYAPGCLAIPKYDKRIWNANGEFGVGFGEGKENLHAYPST